MSSTEKAVILQVLEKYKEMTFLWDKNHRDYRNIYCRKQGQQALLEIFRKFEPHATPQSLTRKIQNLRTNYAKELKKVQDSIAAGASGDEIYVPTLYYFHALNFLGETYCSTKDTLNTEACMAFMEALTSKHRLDENREPKPKKLREDNFTIVKKCCVNLVKKHGRSVTLFDDRAFRELINLIPMTQTEKQTINSEYIQKLVDDDELGDDTDMETTMERTTDTAIDDDDETSVQEIKGEVEAVPCTCGKDTDETITRHTVECPASSQQTYWNFFEVSLDSATCQICNNTITWTNISTLKEHLQNDHPSVNFIDDDDEFQKRPPSEDGSTNDFGMEEVFLEDNLSDSEDTSKFAKRRRKKAKAPLNITGPISRENIAASLDRFKSLDCFGQYVASLMKLIPKDKCIKFQIQIVERLLQEQAAAG